MKPGSTASSPERRPSAGAGGAVETPAPPPAAAGAAPPTPDPSARAAVPPPFAAARAGDGEPAAPAHRALPPEAPLAMPRAPLGCAARRLRRARHPWRQAIRVGLARLLLLAVTAVLVAYGIREAWGVISTGGVTALQWVFVALFGVNFTWVAFTLAQTLLGALAWTGAALTGAGRDRDARPRALRTAVLVPVYQESPERTAANVLAMAEDIAHECPDRFAVFLLSDTRATDHWLAEEDVFRRLVEDAPAGCPVYYRNRAENHERKAGNVAEWVSRFGAAWDAMLILDADSLMSGACMRRLAARLEAAPDLGLIQSLPTIARGRTLFARLQQFAGACYGPLYARGLAAWYGRSGNYWGHNAIIRVQAFAEAAKLPVLPGRAPFGGDILSHDFVEAAFLRRAGWGVRFDPDLADSYEETPPSLVDTLVRDRRWCQGNLQHIAVLGARGLSTGSRLHLLTGIYSYLSAPVWLALVLVGLGLALQVQLVPPDYFAEPSLFPTWPVFDTERAVRLLLITLAVVLAPKLLGALSVLLNPARWRAFAGPLNLLASVVWETVLSALYAPILMASQCRTVFAVLAGADAGWKPQRRDDGGLPLTTLLRMHGAHTLLGAGLAGLGWWIEPDLLWWLAPVTAGLIASVPLSMLASSTALGAACRWLGFGRVASESIPVPIIDAAREHQRSGRFRPPEALAAPASGATILRTLATCPDLRRWHFAQQRIGGGDDPHGFGETLLGALAKADRAAALPDLAHWLTPAQLRALLTYAPFEARLAAAAGTDEFAGTHARERS